MTITFTNLDILKRIAEEIGFKWDNEKDVPALTALESANVAFGVIPGNDVLTVVWRDPMKEGPPTAMISNLQLRQMMKDIEPQIRCVDFCLSDPELFEKLREALPCGTH